MSLRVKPIGEGSLSRRYYTPLGPSCFNEARSPRQVLSSSMIFSEDLALVTAKFSFFKYCLLKLISKLFPSHFFFSVFLYETHILNVDTIVTLII